MNGQIFLPGRFVEAQAKIEHVTPPPLPTPYVALAVNPQMLLSFLEVARPVGKIVRGRDIPICHFNLGLEYPHINTTTKAIATVDNRRGLQIVLCSVAGERVRKDGIPYHMIWSYNPPENVTPIIDNDYEWPAHPPEDIEKDKGDLTRNFERKAEAKKVRCQRIIDPINKQAEDLAMLAYNQCESLGHYMFSTPQIDYLPLNKDIDVPSKHGTWIRPDIAMIVADPDGTRHAEILDYF